MFRQASHSAFEEMNSRRDLRQKLLTFGVSFLDDALSGILPGDLILVGATPGVGKTQFCCNMAFQNITKGKKVHYFALEAERYEIERRIKYQIFADLFYKDKFRPKINQNLSYDNWLLGDFMDSLWRYETKACEIFEANYKGLFLYYKESDFTVESLIEQVLSISNETDLVIVDHAHYFDFDSDNENMAMKKIAKTTRTLALEENKPIVLIAHLRKKDKFATDLAPGLEEFHGTSDLYKIATKCVTFAPGPRLQGFDNEEVYATFFRTPKNRINGSVTRYIAAIPYHVKGSTYDENYKLCWSNASEFQELDRSAWPQWYKRQRVFSGTDNYNAQNEHTYNADSRGASPVQEM